MSLLVLQIVRRTHDRRILAEELSWRHSSFGVSRVFSVPNADVAPYDGTLPTSAILMNKYVT